MSLEEARAVPWPFKESTLKRQSMGYLLDTQQITLQDLGFAAEKAYDRVKKASRILLLHRLQNTPDEQSGLSAPLKLTTSKQRSYTAYRQLALFMSAGMIPGFMLGFATFLIIQWLYDRLTMGEIERQSLNATVEQLSQAPVLGVILSFVLVIGTYIAAGLIIYRIGVFLLDRFLMPRFTQTMKHLDQAQRGEDAALHTMFSVLDGRSHVFRNLHLPNSREDMDFVLVGPGGVWLIEVKTLKGQYRNQGDSWELWKRGGWRSAFIHPSKQAKRGAARLQVVLKEHGVRWVDPYIVMADPETVFSTHEPAVPVHNLDEFGAALRSFQQQSKLSSGQVAQISSVLGHLAQGDDEGQDCGSGSAPACAE
jgi:hypothetical protein